METLRCEHRPWFDVDHVPARPWPDGATCQTHRITGSGPGCPTAIAVATATLGAALAAVASMCDAAAAQARECGDISGRDRQALAAGTARALAGTLGAHPHTYRA